MLYRIEPCEPPCVHGNTEEHASLVPVEPCEHGKIDPHFTGSDSWVGDEFQPVEKCEGAALKEGT